jgi:flagellar hook-length control protein FliK
VRKKDQPETADAPVDSAREEKNAIERPDADVNEDGEVIAEGAEPEASTGAATTEKAATPDGAPIAAAMPPAPTAGASDDAVETAEGEGDEAPEGSIPPQPLTSATPKANAPVVRADEAPVNGLIVPEDTVVAEEATAETRPAEPVKQASKPSPVPAAKAEEKPAAATPAQVASSLESLEQSVAVLNDSPSSPTAPAPAADVTPSASGVLLTVTDRPAPTTTQPAAPAPLPPAPTQSFADVNHPKIVTSVRGELLPSGGTMQIHLDPPELGALQVLVHMRDGTMTASFQTSNDDATRLLSHSLGQLKQALESQGVSVDKLHVQQSPRDQQAGSDDHRQQQNAREDESARHEQQRKEMVRRMWRRLANGQDPLDLVA